MEKIYIECDGCGKEIKKQNSYSIYIYQNPDENGGFTANGAIDNLNNYFDRYFGKETTYCEDCTKKIKDFIDELNCVK